MHIVMVSSECSPIAKVGGLADVVIGLSKALQERGEQVEIILPKYDNIRYDKISDLQIVCENLSVPYAGGWIENEVLSGIVEGVKCFFIDAKSHNFFNRGEIYGQQDDIERFAYFSKAVLEFLYKENITPDIIHCHDWPTGLLPALQREIYYSLGMTHPRLVYTIHNFAHQGTAHQSAFERAGGPSYKLPYETRNHDNINFMKIAICYSDYVTTVSPTYANEVRFTDKGMGLQSLLNANHHKFIGILNGIDYEFWNPETDEALSGNYSLSKIAGKYENKKQLRQKFWLADDYKPLVAIISRLVGQKGVDMMAHSIYYSIQKGAQVVLLGSSPEPAIDAKFKNIKHELNDHPDCHLELGFNEELSHLIYAGADLIVIPSLFEPCGLTQLISMRYGTVPVVRQTGGLADTVIDSTFTKRPWEERNGYVFTDANNAGLESALGRAIDCWYQQPQIFNQLVTNGMEQDFSWKRSGQTYLAIYNLLHGPQ